MKQIILLLFCISTILGQQYDIKRGLDCYAGKGGVPVPGQAEPYHKFLTPTQCQAACTSDSVCKAVVRPTGSSGGPCWKRSSVTVSQCVRDPTYDVYIKGKIHV